jgi:surface antigen
LLPNCTNYAYGRILELGGQNLTLSHSDAGDWYTNTGDGYQRGQTPVQGAVACWYCGGSIGRGHVAVVEDIDGNDIIISDSDYVSSEKLGDKSVQANVWNNPHYFGRSRKGNEPILPQITVGVGTTADAAMSAPKAPSDEGAVTKGDWGRDQNVAFITVFPAKPKHLSLPPSSSKHKPHCSIFRKRKIPPVSWLLLFPTKQALWGPHF